MDINCTPDQKEFIRRAIDAGRFVREEDAVREALSLWEERERRRMELLAALDAADADLKAGHYNDYTNATLPTLADELKHEARASHSNGQT